VTAVGPDASTGRPRAAGRRDGTPAIAAALALGLVLAACTTPLELGERRYREGDRLAALEAWREVRGDSPYHEAAQRRIAAVENEFEQLVVRYVKRARYYERKGRLAESVLNYRLALKLQPDDRETLAHVQELARVLAERRQGLDAAFRESFERGDLAAAREHLDALRTLDPFAPQVATHERQLESALQGEVETLLARGRRGFSSGNHAAAEQAFQAVLELDPGNENAQGYLSYIAKIRDEEQAPPPPGRPRLEPPEVRATDTEIRAEGFYQNALAAERRGDPFAAIDYDEAALRADPSHPHAASHLAGLRGRLASEVEGLIASGREYYQQEDLQSALDQWGRALRIDPGNTQAQEYRARAERLLENLERLRSEPDAAGAS